MVVLLLQQSLHNPEACSTFASAGLLGGILAIWGRNKQPEVDDNDDRETFRQTYLDRTPPGRFPLVTNTGIEPE